MRACSTSRGIRPRPLRTTIPRLSAWRLDLPRLCTTSPSSRHASLWPCQVATDDLLQIGCERDGTLNFVFVPLSFHCCVSLFGAGHARGRGRGGCCGVGWLVGWSVVAISSRVSRGPAPVDDGTGDRMTQAMKSVLFYSVYVLRFPPLALLPPPLLSTRAFAMHVSPPITKPRACCPTAAGDGDGDGGDDAPSIDPRLHLDHFDI